MAESRQRLEPIWCMVGNIVERRPYGEGGVETRIGTRHFYERIKVIGYHKGTRGRHLVVMIIRSAWVENRRAELVYKPSIISRFEGAWDGSLKSKRLAQALVSLPDADSPRVKRHGRFGWIRDGLDSLRRLVARDFT